MLARCLLLALGALLLCAASEPLAPPAVLQPYIKDGRFDPGDYGWMRGRFADASPEEKDQFQLVNEWFGKCFETAGAKLRKQLRAEGYPNIDVEHISLAPSQCAGFGQPFLSDFNSFASFQREVAAVSPLADGFLAATALAEESAQPPERGPTLARQLQARIVGEQTIRRGLTWGRGVGPGAPRLSGTAQAILQSRLASAMNGRDYANTEWLKGVVAEHGWPKISDVGKEASSAAWLLVQHADQDPLFQLKALRLMEPLVTQKEVSGRDFAYLTDRVMLKLTGKQRYGTQFTCVDGRFTPLPIDDESAVARLRREAGMETQEENAARINASYGRCG